MSEGGGAFTPPASNCLSDEQREQIVQALEKKLKMLRKQGRIMQNGGSVQRASFAWPLKQAEGFNDNSYYGISAFVDHDISYPDKLKDFNCGKRSYDLNSGYNHTGTDIFLWPFGRTMQSKNQVQVVAAEAGTIIEKQDGNFDENCAMCSNCSWNAVYIQHSDGSVAWYGHLKKNSLTKKGVGQVVEKGEFLGFVGSSGISTGPHLHFEVYKNTTYTRENRIDPFGGPCNSLNGNESYWDEQKWYQEPTLNKIMTHSAAPDFNNQTCPALELVNDETSFQGGNVIYFASYFHDQLQGTVTNCAIYDPANRLISNWDLNPTESYNASWWYRSYTFPTNATKGNWRYVATYNGQTLTHHFTIGVPKGLNLESGSLRENQAAGSLAGTLSSSSSDPSEIFTYSLVKGEGDTDNNLFTVNGNEIRSAAVLDYEEKQIYSLRLRSVTPEGYSQERQLTIPLEDENEEPTAIALSSSELKENNKPGATVGTFTCTDQDVNDTHTYSLVAGEGDTDNASFFIDGKSLKAAALFDYETKNNFSVRVKVKDKGGLWYETSKDISIIDEEEKLTSLAGEEDVKVKVCPNPGRQSLLVSADGPIDYVNLINCYGKTILSKTGNSGELRINLEPLAAGIYIAVISSQGKVNQLKVVVEK